MTIYCTARDLSTLPLPRLLLLLLTIQLSPLGPSQVGLWRQTVHFVPLILSFSLSPDCPQQSLCCFNGCRNVCIPEQSVQRLKQYSNKDTWRSQYEENNSKVRSRLEHGFQKRYPELSGQEKNDYPGTVTYQSKKLLTVKSVERATKKNKPNIT